jgi:hypothetical protein
MAETKVKKQHDESEWDKKKIILFVGLVLILLLTGISIKEMFLGSSYTPKAAQGITASIPQINVKKNVQDQINALQKEAQNINLVDVATSSPQVQKVIHDLQELKDYPNNQIKQTCVNICSKL